MLDAGFNIPLSGTPIQLLREDWGDLFDRSIRAISSAAAFPIQFVELIGEPDTKLKACTKFIGDDMDVVQHLHAEKVDISYVNQFPHRSHAHLE